MSELFVSRLELWLIEIRLFIRTIQMMIHCLYFQSFMSSTLSLVWKNRSAGNVRCETYESDLTSRKKEARNEKFHDLLGQLLIYTLQSDNFR